MAVMAGGAHVAETFHVVAGFEKIDCCNNMWKLFGKCKTLVRFPTVLMVKIVLFPRRHTFPSLGSVTRYPCFPRGLRTSPLGSHWCIQNFQLHAEFSGRHVGELLQAVKRALSWSCSLLGRAPDYLFQRVGGSARMFRLLGLWQHSVIFSYRGLGLRRGVRTDTGAYVYISSNVPFHLHAVMHRRHFLGLFGGRMLLWRLLLEFLCPKAVKVVEFSNAMSVAVFGIRGLPQGFTTLIELSLGW